MTRRRIKLMADYHCWALWEAGEKEVGNIDPATLPLSEATRRALAAWVESYDRTLNWDDPGGSHGQTPEFLEAFRCEGGRLLLRLREELGPDFEVVGDPEHVRESS